MGKGIIITSVSSGVLTRECGIRSFKLVVTKTRGGVNPTNLAIIVIGRSLLSRDRGLPSVLSCIGLSGGRSALGAPPIFTVCTTNLIFGRLLRRNNISTTRGHGRRGSHLLCRFLSGSGLFGSPIFTSSQSAAGVPFIANSRRLSQHFVGRTSRTKFGGLGNRQLINNVQTDLCGTFPLRNIETLIRFVRGFRARIGKRGW